MEKGGSRRGKEKKKKKKCSESWPTFLISPFAVKRNANLWHSLSNGTNVRVDIVKNRRLKICESSRQRNVEKNRWEMFNGVEKLLIRKSSVIVSFINKHARNTCSDLKIYIQYVIFAIYINNYEISPPSLEINIAIYVNYIFCIIYVIFQITVIPLLSFNKRFYLQFL